MQPVTSFALRSEASVDDTDRGPLSAVVRDGRDVGLTIAGATLEGQFILNTGEYLLLVTNNSPYEERLHLYLLDRDLRLAEKAEIGAAYTAGILRDLHPSATSDSLEFVFTNRSRFRLQVHASPGRFWNPSGGLQEAARSLSKRRLQIERMRSDG